MVKALICGACIAGLAFGSAVTELRLGSAHCRARALREEVEDRVELRFSCSISAIENSPTGVTATLTDGSCADADLPVGADGIHSTARRLIFGPEETFFRYLGFHTAAYIFEDPEIHVRVSGRFCLTDSAKRLMGPYGLRDGIATFCVHRTAHRGDSIQLAYGRQPAPGSVRLSPADSEWPAPT